MTSRTSDVLLGIVFFGALIGLGAVTIALSDFKFGAPRYDVDLVSPDVGYLRAGDPVLLYGMATGKVQSIQRLASPVTMQTPEGRPVECRVLVRTRLDADLYARLPVDSHLYVEDRGLLGGKLVRIETGTSDRLHERDEPLLAIARKSVLEAAGEVLDENRIGLRRTVDNLVQMTDNANAGRGLLGAFVRDESVAHDFRSVITDLRGSAADVRSVTASVRAGEGTLGKLISDDALYVDAQDVMVDARGLLSDAREVAGKINRGDGTLGRLVNDPALYDRAGRFFDDMTVLSQDVRAGKGLLGALLADEKLAEDFRNILRHALGAIEDARESTPVQSVGSFLFGTF